LSSRGKFLLTTEKFKGLNEAARIGPLVRSALEYAGEVIVVEDGSVDETAASASSARIDSG